MKASLDIPDALLHAAKAEAARRGMSLRAFVTEALEVKLARDVGFSGSGERAHYESH